MALSGDLPGPRYPIPWSTGEPVTKPRTGPQKQPLSSSQELVYIQLRELIPGASGREVNPNRKINSGIRKLNQSNTEGGQHVVPDGLRRQPLERKGIGQCCEV